MGRPALTLIPPGLVSERSQVEARLTVPGDGRPKRISVYLDRVEPGSLVADDSVAPAPGELATTRWRWPVSQQVGDHSIICTIGSDQGSTHVSRPLTVERAATRALPRFLFGWLDPGGVARGGYARDGSMVDEDVRQMIDAMHALGMVGVVITYVEWWGAFYYPSDIEFYDRDEGRMAGGQHLEFDLVEAVLSRADDHGMAVFLGLGRGGDMHLLWEFEDPAWAERNAAALEIGLRIADELHARYGHHRSLYGWYFSHEMNDLARASAYYDPLARHLRSIAPGSVVMAAPAGTPILDAEILRSSEVDIFAYQDAVGAGYVPYEYTWDPERRLAMLDDVYASYRAAHEGTDKHLWADVELWEMDGSEGYNGSYPPTFDRVQRQIEVAARYVDVLTAYEYSGFLESPGSRVKLKDPRAVQLYQDYARYLEEAAP